VAVGDVAEAELREEVPDAGPSAGEHAGSGCLGGGAEPHKDEDEDVVGERAEAIL
jgi:hypothetical protein